jgi:hypothetical protein
VTHIRCDAHPVWRASGFVGCCGCAGEKG